jgi:hypothetical protein
LAASTRRWASVESAVWSNRSELADFDESFEAGDGEEITNKFLTLECKSADPSDVPDSRGLQAFSCTGNERISAMPQRLVNHVSQALVNHAGG